MTAVLKPAGLDNAKDILSAAFVRDPSDPRWQGTREQADFAAFMKQYYPEGDASDALNVTGYSMAQTMVQVLRQAGDNLTRANIMKQAASTDMTLPMLYPGIKLKTSPTNFHPLAGMQMVRFNGSGYDPVGGVIGQ